MSKTSNSKIKSWDKNYKSWYVTKRNSELRGTPYNLTYEEWSDWWGDDVNNRGKKRGGVVMCRIDMNKAYSLDNIKKIYKDGNASTTADLRTAHAPIGPSDDVNAGDRWSEFTLEQNSK